MNMRLAFWGMTWVWLLLGLIAGVVDGSQRLAPNKRQVEFPQPAPYLVTK
jgi:hypothetical protein